MDHDQIVSDRIIGCAIEVHRNLGPGLLEKPYLVALCAELAHAGITFERERSFPMLYRGVELGTYIPDLIVEGTVIVEVKSVAHFDPVFTAQVITYLRITKLRVGLLLNFNRPKLMDGIKRVVL
jgi:GxxExxY protein